LSLSDNAIGEAKHMATYTCAANGCTIGQTADLAIGENLTLIDPCHRKNTTSNFT
jgi:hypothetical protein